ncbi:MAG: hypothetical protein ACXVBG_21940, partial [Isosphaeraceae bacterium]
GEIPRFLDKSQHFTVHLFRPWTPSSARDIDGGPRRFTEVVPTPHAYSAQWPVKTKRARARSCASVVTRKRPSLNRAAFPIQDDDHLLAVLRYVERNPLHAGLVGRAEAWEWSSLHGHAQGPLALWLDPGPVLRGPQWVGAVNAPMFETELWGFRGHHTESSGDEHGVPGTPDAGSTPRHPSRD